MRYKSLAYIILFFFPSIHCASFEWKPPSYIFLEGNPWAHREGGHSITVGDCGFGWQLKKRDPDHAWFFALTEFNYSYFFGKKRLYEKQKKSVSVFGGALIFRWVVPKNSSYLKEMALRPWIQLGSGPQFFTSRYVCFKQRPLSTKLQFATQLGLGARFGKQEKLELGAFYRHYSNANIKYPNLALDIVVVRMAYWF